MKVTWAEQQGYADDYSWHKTGEDIRHEGEVVGYIAMSGLPYAIVKTSDLLLEEIRLDELRVVE